MADQSVAARVGRACALAVLMMLVALPAMALDRRRAQFQTEPSYLILPFPYSLPGIGDGIAWTGLLGNAFGTHADAYGIIITGDASGQIIGVQEIHLLPELLILDVNYQNINRAVVNSYQTRGMDSSGDDYKLIEVNQADYTSGELRLTLFERRFELAIGAETVKTAVVSIRDADGNLIQELAEPYRQESSSRSLRTLIDYTDDFEDPRRGVRFGVRVSESPPKSTDDPDYRVWDYALNGYIPIGRISTLLLSYFQSDAQVLRPGNTDPAAIKADLGLNCAPTDTACLDAEAQLVQEQIDGRSHGTSTSLGGENRLRAYPGGRYSGAHTVFVGTEFRWNLTEEVTPFDYFIWKDVRTNIQIAFFAETGSVGETRDEVGDIWRSAYGVGLRMVSASGFVYRADVATGHEGTEVSVIFGYPY